MVGLAPTRPTDSFAAPPLSFRSPGMPRLDKRNRLRLCHPFRQSLTSSYGTMGYIYFSAKLGHDQKFWRNQKRRNQKRSKKKKSKAKKHKIKVDRIEVCAVDQDILPNDAEFKGYESVIVQEIHIKTENVEYKKEIYSSPSQKKTYMGKLPPGIEGEFAHGVKSLVCTLKHVANVSESRIHEFLDNFEIFISPASISRILTTNNELFHREKADIFRAGLLSTCYQQIDDTGSRVRGQNHHAQIVCNPFYTAYFTTPRKDRLTVLDILRGDPDGKARSYCFNEEAFDLLDAFGLSSKLIFQ